MKVFTIPSILVGDKPWADPQIASSGFSPKFNALDGQLNRRSWEGVYKVNEKGYPLNVVGRTGLGGRGSLGKWGPNHAADCIVTRYLLTLL
jgi:ADP-ribose pyrophosphatase